MARLYTMTWEGSPYFRWVKMYRGERYRVSCDDLRMPKDKVESYVAANEWWRKQRASIEGASPSPKPEHAHDLAVLNRRIEWASTNDTSLIASLQKERTRLLTLSHDDVFISSEASRNIQAANTLGIDIPHDISPIIIEKFFGDKRTWEERHSTMSAGVHTIGQTIEKFLRQVSSKQKPITHRELKSYFDDMMMTSNVLTPMMPTSLINEKTMSDHFDWLISKDYEPDGHNKRLGFLRRYIRWLAEHRLMETVPRNINSKDHRKKTVYKEAKVWDDVHETLDMLPDLFRLWALLGLNCGMSQADWGNLTWDMIDLKKGILTRRRVKTEDNPHSPKVSYKLWPEVLALLKRMPQNKRLVFTTKNGMPMYRTWYDDDGKPKKKDMFSTRWNTWKAARLKKGLPVPVITPSKFRNMGSHILKSHAIHRQYKDFFLEHVPTKLSDKTYGREHDKPFFHALAYIHDEVFGKPQLPRRA